MAADEVYGFQCESRLGGTLTIHISRQGARVTLAASLCKRNGLARMVHKPVSGGDWERLQSALRRADFWTLPDRHDRMGLDGATWTIEGRNGEGYHRTERWDPPPGPYRDLGHLFLELGGLELPHDTP